MTTQNIAIPSVSVINNHAVTTSLAVAGFFGKRHDNIIRSIDNLKPDLDPVFYALNFEEIQNQVDLGLGRARLDRAFNLTKDGFMLLVMGFTGKQAMQFKIAYINRFNEMENALHNPLALTNGQHYVVAKDGVVIFHKVLSDRTAKGYLQHKPTQECEHALGLMKSLQDVAKLSGDISYGQVRDGIRQLLIHLGQYQPYEQVRPAIIVLEAAERMMCRLWTMIDEAGFRAALVESYAKKGLPLKDYEHDTVTHIRQILSKGSMAVQLPHYQ